MAACLCHSLLALVAAIVVVVVVCMHTEKNISDTIITCAEASKSFKARINHGRQATGKACWISAEATEGTLTPSAKH